MRLTGLGPDAPFYRAITPKWAYRAESGAGAAVVGGRFNRPGVEARYLADSPAGALTEYQAESALLPPATVATFLVTAEVVDFSQGYDPEHWSPLWAEAYCNWKGLAFLENVDPPSWDIGDLVREKRIAGILYRSARNPGVRCLVLYPEFADQFQADVYDPDGRLPLDAGSWTRQPAKSDSRRFEMMRQAETLYELKLLFENNDRAARVLRKQSEVTL